MTKSGYLLLNKPKDWTSFDVVKKTQNILKTKKVGHIGTLDPFATGLLVLLVNDATKLSQYLVNLDKEYIVRGKFGEMTDTGDITGKPVEFPEIVAAMSSSPSQCPVAAMSSSPSQCPVAAMSPSLSQCPVSKDDFLAMIPTILALKSQTPSKYSAIKINGQRAYKMARSGKDFEMPQREIEIKEFELLDYDFPYFTYRALVSKGTYVRTLTEQIAALFDTIAVSVELHRTKIGQFDVKDATPMSDVTAEIELKPINTLPVVQKPIPGKSTSAGEKKVITRVTTPGSIYPETKNRKQKTENRQSRPSRPVITIGTFDGVHLGHQFLLTETVKKAKELQTEAIVITYLRHPLETINETIYPYLLTEYDKKEQLIYATGIDKIKYLHFDKAMSQLTPESFLKNILLKEFNPRLIMVGYDTHFGVDRSGNSAFLIEQAKMSIDSNMFKSVFEVIDLPPLKIKDTIPSSSMIRDLIKAGNISQANLYLGRHYSIIGKVISGKKLGRTLGFPTINLLPSEKNKLLPQTGVYFTITEIEKKKYSGVTNVGFAPTIQAEKNLKIETHLLDFSIDLYDETIEVYFVKRLRDEMVFDSSEDLIKQIERDVKDIDKIDLVEAKKSFAHTVDLK